MVNLMLLLTFSVLDGQEPFWVDFVQTIKIVCFRVEFGIKTYSSMLNSMEMFTILSETRNTLLVHISFKTSRLYM